jgi:hypothetical protein
MDYLLLGGIAAISILAALFLPLRAIWTLAGIMALAIAWHVAIGATVNMPANLTCVTQQVSQTGTVLAIGCSTPMACAAAGAVYDATQTLTVPGNCSADRVFVGGFDK